jgi:2-polyprenyl-3-methyl-5-hydroxy-6-metoxy-1,4-benzoquinol methylase
MPTYEIAACPACRSSTFHTIADREEIKEELEALWQFHVRRMKTGAPIDQFFDRAIFSQAPPLQVVQCDACGTVFRNPREDADELVETYEQEEPDAEALRSLFDQQLEFFRPRVKKLTELNGNPGEVLEVGSYIGGFLRAAQAEGWRGTGVDVNAAANAFAREQGCNVIETTLADYEADARYDVVALWNCFDQLPDPHATLQKVAELVPDNGLTALRVPNGAFYAALRDRNSTVVRPFLAWNNIASFPYRHGFTAESLEMMLEQHGFRTEQVIADTLVPISGHWTRRWARLEEGILKAAMRIVLPARVAPWLEVYARKAAH